MFKFTALAQQFWNYCDMLQNEGLSCGVAKMERRLSAAEELEAVADANLQRATRLRQAILQKAFARGLCR